MEQAQHRVFVGHYLKSPLDQSPNDPWISFPGDANGNMAAQLAHFLFDRLMRHADYLIDIHTPTTGGRYAPFAFLPPPDAGAAAVAAEAMAKAFGVDYILSTDQGLYVSEQSPHVVLARRGFFFSVNPHRMVEKRRVTRETLRVVATRRQTRHSKTVT